mmetsp:Transcript_26240/g.66099  ORF Transcript_26240/g.66099 Transcript_26240/m.66099 type:complete len:273 (+) Transcript_26240:2006-2824(+)
MRYRSQCFFPVAQTAHAEPRVVEPHRLLRFVELQTDPQRPELLCSYLFPHHFRVPGERLVVLVLNLLVLRQQLRLVERLLLVAGGRVLPQRSVPPPPVLRVLGVDGPENQSAQLATHVRVLRIALVAVKTGTGKPVATVRDHARPNEFLQRGAENLQQWRAVSRLLSCFDFFQEVPPPHRPQQPVAVEAIGFARKLAVVATQHGQRLHHGVVELVLGLRHHHFRPGIKSEQLCRERFRGCRRQSRGQNALEGEEQALGRGARPAAALRASRR